jgi:hypothetical protein
LGEGLKAVTDVAYSQGMKDFVGMGAQELAAALFGSSGSGFVMYPRTPGAKEDQSIEGPDHGLGNQGLDNKEALKESQGLKM